MPDTYEKIYIQITDLKKSWSSRVFVLAKILWSSRKKLIEVEIKMLRNFLFVSCFVFIQRKSMKNKFYFEKILSDDPSMWFTIAKKNFNTTDWWLPPGGLNYFSIHEFARRGQYIRHDFVYSITRKKKKGKKDGRVYLFW